MKIVETEQFKFELEEIINFITQDKIEAAINFAIELKESINNLIVFPYMYRKSIYFNDDNIRDMVFKKYTVVYEVKKNKIVLLSIFKENKPKGK